jgi:hypothetical protein
MDEVFGQYGWRDRRYETVNLSRLFSPFTNFIYMEGGDNNANALQAFLSAHGSSIANWVANGGRLFINAAPNQGGNIDMGFGVTLNFNMDYTTSSLNGVAVDNAGFTNGPIAPAGTIFSGGDSFSHAYLTGDGLKQMIQDDQGRTVLGQMSIGSGFVMFGTMTADIFQAPYPSTHNLRVNVLYYTATRQD